MKCLVTGAAGFIGSHLAEALVADGARVVGVDGFLDNYPRQRKLDNLRALDTEPGFGLVEGTLQGLDLPALLEGVDCVFHLGALPGVRPSWGQSFSEYLEHNVLATQRLLEACREKKGGKLIYASSSSVYGDTDQLPMREGARERPFSPYGVTKLAGELLVRLYHRNFDLPALSLRYFTVYGPRQRPDMAIQRFLTAAARGEPVTIFGDGEQSRDFTYVADAVAATLLAAEKGQPGCLYNVGGGSRLSVNELVAAIERITGRSLEKRSQPAKPGDVATTHADCSLARSVLGFEARTPLQEGLARQWASMRDVSGSGAIES